MRRYGAALYPILFAAALVIAVAARSPGQYRGADLALVTASRRRTRGARLRARARRGATRRAKRSLGAARVRAGDAGRGVDLLLRAGADRRRRDQPGLLARRRAASPRRHRDDRRDRLAVSAVARAPRLPERIHDAIRGAAGGHRRRAARALAASITVRAATERTGARARATIARHLTAACRPQYAPARHLPDRPRRAPQRACHAGGAAVRQLGVRGHPARTRVRDPARDAEQLHADAPVAAVAAECDAPHATDPGRG